VNGNSSVHYSEEEVAGIQFSTHISLVTWPTLLYKHANVQYIRRFANQQASAFSKFGIHMIIVRTYLVLTVMVYRADDIQNTYKEYIHIRKLNSE